MNDGIDRAATNSSKVGHVHGIIQFKRESQRQGKSQTLFCLYLMRP